MAAYRLTNKAVEDLNKIWEYTFGTWSEEQADQYYGMLLSLCKDMSANPDIGRNYESIRPGLFRLVAIKHIIFYHVVESGLIEIIRILHGRMDLKNRILE